MEIILINNKINFMSSKTFWSIDAPYITEFIAFKRSLGYKYEAQEGILLRLRILLNFDKFLLKQPKNFIGLSKEITDNWAEKRDGECELSRYGRVICISQFSSYLRNRGIKSYIPQLPKYPESTFIPHIYSYDEMATLFKACDSLRLRKRDMSSSLFVMPCLLRMLYATGIRVGEALSLQNCDVDLNDKCLILRGTKNRKDRLVPFTDTLTDVCKDYLKYKNKLPIINIDGDDHPFFVTLNGSRCKRDSVYKWFRKTLNRAGIPFTGNRRGPRVHDVRHSFSCHSFVKLADEGMDLYCSWPYLSAYLGHQSLEATEQYVRLTAQLYPELLKDADRLYVNILPNINNNQNQIL
jgi:integrase/recombinase XerD